MIIDQTITRYIDKQLVLENEEKEALHKKSGGLSASRLGDPLQWQILNALGVPSAPFDPYTLRKFKRGVSVEEWLVENIPGIVTTQKFVEYDGAVGYVDALVDHSNYEFKSGILPHEIKSVTNAKFKRIQDTGAPDAQHILQATLYAMALDKKHFVIDYVASDDLRVLSYVIETDKNRQRVNNIIKTYKEQLEKKEIPVFKPVYSWQKSKEYSKYPEWMDLTEEEIKEKMDRLNIHF